MSDENHEDGGSSVLGSVGAEETRDKENDANTITSRSSLGSRATNAGSGVVSVKRIANALEVGKKKKDKHDKDSVERAEDAARGEVFNAWGFFPDETWWEFDGELGFMVADIIGLVILDKKHKKYSENRESWLNWFENNDVAKRCRDAHHKRRSNVAGHLKVEFRSRWLVVWFDMIEPGSQHLCYYMMLQRELLPRESTATSGFRKHCLDCERKQEKNTLRFSTFLPRVCAARKTGKTVSRRFSFLTYSPTLARHTSYW